MDQRIVCPTYSEYLMKVKEMIAGGEFSKENGGQWIPQDDAEHNSFGILFYKFLPGVNGAKDVEVYYHLLVPREAMGAQAPETNPLFQEVLSVFEIVQHNLAKEIKAMIANGVH